MRAKAENARPAVATDVSARDAADGQASTAVDLGDIALRAAVSGYVERDAPLDILTMLAAAPPAVRGDAPRTAARTTIEPSGVELAVLALMHAAQHD